MSSEKRYLVYLASNIKGLDLERYDLLRLLAANNMLNVGFPFREDAGAYDWNEVRPQIENADLFILLLGDDYGPMMPTGISFLHREYVHAKSLNKPIVAFLKAIPTARVLSEEQRRLDGFQRIIMPQSTYYHWHKREELITHARKVLPNLRGSLPYWTKHAPELKKSPNVVEKPPAPSIAIKPLSADERQLRLSEVVSLQVSANVFKGGNLALEEVLLPARIDQLLLMLEDHLKRGASTDRLRTRIEQLITPTIKKQLLQRNRHAHAVDDVRLNKAQFQHLLTSWQTVGLITSRGEGARVQWYLFSI